MNNINETYNGWKNRSTWNVALWILNDESLYTSAVEFMKRHKSHDPYHAFIQCMGITQDQTPDGVCWESSLLDSPRLNEMMRELIA